MQTWTRHRQPRAIPSEPLQGNTPDSQVRVRFDWFAAISCRLCVGVFWERQPCMLVALLWCTGHYFIPSAQIWFLPHLQKLGIAPCKHHFGTPPPSAPHFLDTWTRIRLPDCKVTSTQKNIHLMQKTNTGISETSTLVDFFSNFLSHFSLMLL